MIIKQIASPAKITATIAATETSTYNNIYIYDQQALSRGRTDHFSNISPQVTMDFDLWSRI